MSMTARQIRDALKPMKDFAPAILAAAEIADEAERYDSLISTKAAEAQKIEQDIATSRQALAAVIETLRDQSEKLGGCNTVLASEQAAMDRALADAVHTHQQKMDRYVAEAAEKESHLAALNRKIDEANATLTKAQDDLRVFRADLKKALPVT